jgi:hypothetical protein
MTATIQKRLCLLQERGSNNGLTIPGAPSYGKRGAATTAQQYWVHLLMSREGQQQRLNNTGCTFLRQERGSNNGLTIPGWCTFLATSREGQQQRLDNNTWLVVLLLMSREGQQQWLNDVWRRRKAQAWQRRTTQRCCSMRKCVLNMKDIVSRNLGLYKIELPFCKMEFLFYKIEIS